MQPISTTTGPRNNKGQRIIARRRMLLMLLICPADGHYALLAPIVCKCHTSYFQLQSVIKHDFAAAGPCVWHIPPDDIATYQSVSIDLRSANVSEPNGSSGNHTWTSSSQPLCYSSDHYGTTTLNYVAARGNSRWSNTNNRSTYRTIRSL